MPETFLLLICYPQYTKIFEQKKEQEYTVILESGLFAEKKIC